MPDSWDYPPRPGMLDLGRLSSRSVRAKLYIEDDDGPICGFDLSGPIETEIRQDYDYDDVQMFRGDQMLHSVMTSPRLPEIVFRGRVRAMHDGTA